MAFRFFLIPIASSEEATTELNTFLGSHRIIRVDRQWIDQGSSSLWSFCVEYLQGSRPVGETPGLPPQRGKKDYKELLSPADFLIFAKLREVRKAIGQVESVPVYTIFTNEQLAQMVQNRATTRASLARIPGVGDARLEKYAPQMLAILSTAWKDEAAEHEASGESVRGDSRPQQSSSGNVEGTAA